MQMGSIFLAFVSFLAFFVINPLFNNLLGYIIHQRIYQLLGHLIAAAFWWILIWILIWLTDSWSHWLILLSFHCVKSVQIRNFFWSVFSCIWTEYGEILHISPYSVRMRENTDQKKLRIWTLFTQCLLHGCNGYGETKCKFVLHIGRPKDVTLLSVLYCKFAFGCVSL